MENIKVAFFLHSSDLSRAWGHHEIVSLARELYSLGFESYVTGYYSLAVLSMERAAYSDLLGKISTIAANLASARRLKPLAARLGCSNLTKFLVKHKIDIVFSTWAYPNLAEAAERSDSRLVIWDLDSPSTLGDEWWLGVFGAADLIITYSLGAARIFRRLGFDNVHWMPHFHDPTFFFPTSDACKTFRLIFIGDYFWQRMKRQGLEIILEPLARKYKDRLVIHGRGWPDVPYADCTLRGGPIDWRQLNAAYNKAYICLNIHRDDQRELDSSLNPRTFDVMGAGAFMLSDYVEGMEKMFKVGQDFAVSRSGNETLELVEYYLANEEERSKIASSGHGAVMSCHTVDRRAGQLAGLLEKLL